MRIIISKNGEKGTTSEDKPFGGEGDLQKFIYENPESIPVDQIKDGIKVLLLKREFNKIDAIGVDKDGGIYIVETKLEKNPDRRQVVAQVLDYGAQLWHNRDSRKFLDTLDSHTKSNFQMTLDQKLGKFFDISDEEVETLKEKIEYNLEKGVFKFVVLMDTIEEKLKRLMNFISANSHFSIYPVEFKYYTYSDENKNYQIIIPKLYGTEIPKSGAPPRSSQTWDESRFFEAVANNLTTEQVHAVRKFYDDGKEIADSINWGKGNDLGSFGLVFYKYHETRNFIQVKTNGNLLYEFSLNLSEEKPLGKEYLEKLKTILDLEKYTPTDNITFTIDKWIKVADKILSITRDVYKY
ncbi:MAG: hypothetical protein ACREAK_06025 [Nitrosarchaeum sp.]